MQVFLVPAMMQPMMCHWAFDHLLASWHPLFGGVYGGYGCLNHYIHGDTVVELCFVTLKPRVFVMFHRVFFGHALVHVFQMIYDIWFIWCIVISSPLYWTPVKFVFQVLIFCSRCLVMLTSLDRSRSYNLGYDMPIFLVFLQKMQPWKLEFCCGLGGSCSPTLNAANPQGDGSQKSFCM